MSATATRYSGSLKVSLRLTADGSYDATILDVSEGTPVINTTISGIRLAPIWNGKAHPEGAFAFDLAARAALSFLAYDNEYVYGLAEEDADTMDGFRVHWNLADALAAIEV